jgi:hypothetical protein
LKQQERISIQKKLEVAYRQNNNFLDMSRIIQQQEKKVARVDLQVAREMIYEGLDFEVEYYSEVEKKLINVQVSDKLGRGGPLYGQG